jgi:hypothetical protein
MTLKDFEVRRRHAKVDHIHGNRDVLFMLNHDRNKVTVLRRSFTLAAFHVNKDQQLTSVKKLKNRRRRQKKKKKSLGIIGDVNSFQTISIDDVHIATKLETEFQHLFNEHQLCRRSPQQRAQKRQVHCQKLDSLERAVPSCNLALVDLELLSRLDPTGDERA